MDRRPWPTCWLPCTGRPRTAGCDQVVLLWDEFGRHLESLLREGRASSLADIQVLAEFVSRTRRVPVTMGLFLHQSLLQYAGGMTQSVRSEWTKIEGRFKTLQYVDDSKEIYRLIAEVVASERGKATLSVADARKAAAKCKEHGLFGEATRTEIKDLLRGAFPLEPATLYLLPRLAARVAQNERTLFSFLYSVDMAGPVGPAHLYDYFGPVMRADTSVGGTYRQWLETESALTKVSSQAESEALKAACLLSLGTSGERSRAGHGLLRFALKGYGEDDEGAAVVRHSGRSQAAPPPPPQRPGGRVARHRRRPSGPAGGGEAPAGRSLRRAGIPEQGSRPARLASRRVQRQALRPQVPRRPLRVRHHPPRVAAAGPVSHAAWIRVRTARCSTCWRRPTTRLPRRSRPSGRT